MQNGPLLAATFNGDRRPLNGPTLAAMFAALPMVTFKIMAAIHWEALRLWIKGAKLVQRPVAEAAATRLCGPPKAMPIFTMIASGSEQTQTSQKNALVR